MSQLQQDHRPSPRTGRLAASFAALALVFGFAACTIELPKQDDDDDSEEQVVSVDGTSSDGSDGSDGKADDPAPDPDPAPDAEPDPTPCLPCSAFFTEGAPLDQLCGAFVDSEGWLDCEPGTSCALAMAVLVCGCNSYCGTRPYCDYTCSTGASDSSCLHCIDDHCDETYACQQDR
ncbi:MAG: hypothetical protein JRI23_15685 [Deltaproteobacteria bacterium]|jgi:hypothetical protein|nr:hypothetical protein [Deltaproteobacteria bacterium]MBW2533202.1 hypothetical protein [Deltaproteobacteria bacterium]